MRFYCYLLQTNGAHWNSFGRRFFACTLRSLQHFPKTILEHVQQWKFHTNFEHVQNGFMHTFMSAESGKKRLPPSILKTYLMFAFRCKEQKNLCVFDVKLFVTFMPVICRCETEEFLLLAFFVYVRRDAWQPNNASQIFAQKPQDFK